MRQIVANLHVPASQRLSLDILWYLYGFMFYSDGDFGPSTVSHVSQTWRQAALQSKFIWAHVTIRLRFFGQQHLRALARFERSGQWPIELIIHATRLWVGDEIDLLVRNHAHRIRTLQVHTKGLCRDLVWHGLSKTTFPILEMFDGIGSVDSQIKVYRPRNREDDDGREYGFVERQAWALVPFTPRENRVGWLGWRPARLTSLILVTIGFEDRPSFNDIHAMLSLSAHTLVNFEYEGFSTPLTNGQALATVELRNLTSMNVAYYDNILPLLDALKLPKLQSLTLRNFIWCPKASARRLQPPYPSYGMWFTSSPGLLRVLSQWTNLKHLGIYAIDKVNSYEAYRYFERLCDLESLVLYGPDGGESFAQGLFSFIKGKPPLPELKSFLCTMTLGRHLAIDRFLICRNAAGMPKLDTLSLNEDFFGFKETLEIIEESAECVFCIDNPDKNLERMPNLTESRTLVNGELRSLRAPRVREFV